MRAVSRAGIASIALAAGLTSAQANAQARAEDNTDNSGIAEIIVTAQKREERLQDVPVTVAALTGATLENANLGNTTALQGLVPGMTINQGQSSSNVVHISLRGISIQDNSKHFESGIGFVLDGVPLGTTTGLVLDSFDVERIEVLRGPQGTLFGRNTTGGAINIVRTKPDPNGPITGRARVTIGNFGRNDYEALLSGPLIEGKLAAKASFISRNDSGTIYNNFRDVHQGDKNFKGYLVSLLATPTDNLTAQLTFERQIDKSELPPTINLLTPMPITLPIPGYSTGANYPCFNPYLDVCRSQLRSSDNRVQLPTDTPGIMKLSALTFNLDWDFDKIKLVGVTGYRKSKEDSFSYLDSTSLGYFPIRQKGPYKQFSQEVRLESNFDGPINFVGGAIYFKSKYSLVQATQLDLSTLPPAAIGLTDPIPPGIAFLTSPISYAVDYWSKSTALFLQVDYQITDALKLIVGGRQTWDEKKINLSLYGAGTGVPGDLYQDFLDRVVDPDQLGTVVGQGRAKAKFKKFTPKVILQYRFNPDAMAYASYSKGYNTGGFNARAATIAFIGPYRPEVLDAYEVGLKTQWFNNKLRFNIAAYFNKMQNKQEDLTVFVTGGASGTTTVNAAKAEYKGVEVELTAAPVQGWTTSLAVGYLDAKYKSFAGNLGQGEAELSSLKLRRTPKWTVGLISDYEFDVGPGRFGINGTLSYVDKHYTNILNDPRSLIPSTTKIDASARYIFPIDRVELKLTGFVKNITNKHPYTGMFSANQPGSNFEFAVPDPGRTYGVSLEARF